MCVRTILILPQLPFSCQGLAGKAGILTSQPQAAQHLISMLQSLCLPACNVIQEEEDYHWYSVCINDVMLCKLIYRNTSRAHGGKCRTDSFRVSVKAEMNGFSTLNFMFENKNLFAFSLFKKFCILFFFNSSFLYQEISIHTSLPIMSLYLLHTAYASKRE